MQKTVRCRMERLFYAWHYLLSTSLDLLGFCPDSELRSVEKKKFLVPHLFFFLIVIRFTPFHLRFACSSTSFFSSYFLRRNRCGV